MISHQRHDISNLPQLECLLNSLFTQTTQETSKLRITVTGGFPSQKTSDAKVFPCQNDTCARKVSFSGNPQGLAERLMTKRFMECKSSSEPLRGPCTLVSILVPKLPLWWGDLGMIVTVGPRYWMAAYNTSLHLDGTLKWHRECLLNCLFRRRSKKAAKVRITGLCGANLSLTGGFPSQKAGNEEIFSFDNVTMSWQRQNREQTVQSQQTVHYYCNATWPLWRLNSPATVLIVRQFVLANIAGNNEALQYFVMGIHRYIIYMHFFKNISKWLQGII